MSNDQPEDTPGAHTVIWARPERAAKGPAPSRSRSQIAAAAVALADAEGLEAVSMRRVAAELGIGAASLYRYVERKDELYDLMVDHAEGEDGAPPPLTGDWRADLTAIAHRTRGMIHRHPWMATLAPGRLPYGPNSLKWAEHNLAAVDGIGLRIDEMLMAGEILQAFVRGFVIGELAEQQALQRVGLSMDEWLDALTPYMTTLMGTGEYPLLIRASAEADSPHAENRGDLVFTAGLNQILNGLLPERQEPDQG
ncbi:TetR/AcrR family transcriptional regulator [Nonomuraea guangzhouensis]|uniref:TetR/AcrR family transcriptional regulator n=1 Tax=Nonomuraea guangzhouensis TaxID=1291555 RepID=A0ABW4GBG6_9ACTN|nr:TetR/AcrR family transcriptional regulator [Nonomuraea guangzhouensis]